MSKNTLLSIALLFLFSLSYAARHEPLHPTDSPQKTQHGGFGEENLDANEGCEGVGEEECLMRRTLVAHTDYIYTQGNKNP
ncbi:phytosulfokines-like [Tasmannia lanceolata]|uniref:phytosulfokines-like n=1 Tax=Tasmannia lanceolata TaxID=3420 RepID=UPI004064C5FC